MRVVIDGSAVRGDNSLSIVTEGLLLGWDRLGGGDELHFVTQTEPTISIPDSVVLHRVDVGRAGVGGRLRAQTFTVPRLCRELKADVMLGMLPATTISPLPCPRAVIAWDFRYRLLPSQFSRKRLLLRRVSYAIGFRQADAVACISERTERDLLSFHPYLARRHVGVAHLGADHVDSWPVRPPTEKYAITFAHFGHKNVDLVLAAWAALATGGTGVLPLHVMGVPAADRPALEATVAALGLTAHVTVNPWLPIGSFRQEFASAGLVVFPSDFEGFGLPVVEAMRLGIPVVITPEPTLLEVTAGHATVVDGEGPAALAAAVERALHRPPGDLVAARAHAERFTWANCAGAVRGVLLAEVVTPRGPNPRRSDR